MRSHPYSLGSAGGLPAAEAPISWYVHLPFCHSKCGYCDFYSLPTQPEWVDALTRAIRREISLRDGGRPVRTIFVGGGTPTVLPADALKQILAAIPRSPVAVEFTVEANPSSADELKLDLLRSQGVNRVSFGAQSFFADELAVLERLHDPSHVPEAVRLARRAGFESLNLDLIFGIPGQTLERFEESLRRAMELEVEHIACYSLMYEEGTALTRRKRQGQIHPADEELELAMFERAIDFLTAAGYEHYETSNFARPGRRCEHNMVYWRNEEYIGIGPSAVSYENGLRTKNVSDIRRYADAMLIDEGARSAKGAVPGPVGLPLASAVRDLPGAEERRPLDIIAESEHLDADGAARETAIQMLRLSEGIDVAAFGRRFGLDPRTRFADAVAPFIASGHLAADDRAIRLTRRGMPVANVVMRAFLDREGAP